MRGFGHQTPERRREIAKMGAKAAKRAGTAHRFTEEEARVAGIKGGASTVNKFGHAYMIELGRRGGLARGIHLRNKKGAHVQKQAKAQAQA